MKVRESGMPEEQLWSSFFDPDRILQQMDVNPDLPSVVDFGCGFGTFTLPASQIIKGKIHAFDIDPDMLSLLQGKIEEQGISNIELYHRDFIAHGTGLPEQSVDYVMLFNILHHEAPHQILKEVYRILKPGAKAGIIHWRSDIATPRGPGLDIRPRPAQCSTWAIESGFVIHKELLLEPYHFGLVVTKS